MKDLHSAMIAVLAIGAATLSADNTATTIDLQGYNAAEILLSIGEGGITFTATNKIAFTLTHSDDDSTYSAVEDEHMLGVSGISTGIIKTLSSAHATAANYRFGYIGGKRYLKLTAVFGGTHSTGTPIAASVLKGRGHDNPQADQA